jgi:CRISPR-associated protein (TIGR03984 family)
MTPVSIEPLKAEAPPFGIDAETGRPPELVDWLAKQASTYKLRWLLAHAYDGVIWGRYDESDGLITSAQAQEPEEHIAPLLRLETLLQCRLFGPAGELLIWKQDDHWQTRLLLESQHGSTPPIDEYQVLWGTRAASRAHDFSLLTEVRQNGMQHIVPIASSDLNDAVLRNRRLRLLVRHYLDEDTTTGDVRIALSRLVELTILTTREGEER